MLRTIMTITLLALLASCAGEPPQGRQENAAEELDPQLVFWDELQGLCGRAFQGVVVASEPPDPSLAEARLVVHAHYCDVAEVRMGFHVGDDRSRTWVITPTAVGLRLRHRHRHEDGSEDELTGYGGETYGVGTETAQEFPADAATAAMAPEAAGNVWTLELHPDSLLAYDLRREGSDRRFRAEFDLTREVEPPPPPWGASRSP
ncbi:MAG: hypothetical protein R3253_00525 [Longimicrobiales bacterium]|nr:hypothetical protein [Longimicrobiales bacterium]